MWLLQKSGFGKAKANYPINVTQVDAVCMGLVYIYMGVSVYWPFSVLCVFVCVFYQIRLLAKKHVIYVRLL